MSADWTQKLAMILCLRSLLMLGIPSFWIVHEVEMDQIRWYVTMKHDELYYCNDLRYKCICLHCEYCLISLMIWYLPYEKALISGHFGIMQVYVAQLSLCSQKKWDFSWIKESSMAIECHAETVYWRSKTVYEGEKNEWAAVVKKLFTSVWWCHI